MQKQQALLAEMMREGYGCERDPAGDEYGAGRSYFRNSPASDPSSAHAHVSLCRWPGLGRQGAQKRLQASIGVFCCVGRAVPLLYIGNENPVTNLVFRRMSGVYCEL